jgi:hypothetical protein
MMDLEREQLRKTYQVSRLGFGLLSVALGLACVDAILPLLAHFHRDLFFLYIRIVRSSWYEWISVPITWGSLLGVTLLWGRWDHASWQRRVGLLLVMNLVDGALWFFEHGTALGIPDLNIGHDWLRNNLGQALGWAEFALLAGLSCDYLDHLGLEQARDSGKSARATAATGAVLWMLLFCERTDWSAAWPLRAHPLRGPEELLLALGSLLIWAITLMQVTALVFSATRQSGYVLEEMRREDELNDPLGKPAGFEDELDPFATHEDVKR